MFSINQKSKKSKARSGVLETRHGAVRTPFFMPIATKGAVKTVDAGDLERLGAEIILSNTYHLMLRPGVEILCQAGGLHGFMGWKKPILTDSGGYQVLSLAKLRKVDEEGVEFADPADGSRHLLTPEKSMEVQEAIGSDIAMILDDLIDYPATREQAGLALERTIRWAKRAKEWWTKHHRHSEQSEESNARSAPKAHSPPANFADAQDDRLLFGIVQGSTFEDQRRRAAEEMVGIGFDGYAHGGLSVGEPREQSYGLTSVVNEILPEDKPRYWMGAGKPEEIVEYVRRGCDMFDCVLPTRNARHGTLYIWKGEVTEPDFYQAIAITNEKFRADFSVLDPNCDCPTCSTGTTRAYLRHLFSIDEPLAARLATLHNVRFYLRLMEKIREAIEDNKL